MACWKLGVYAAIALNVGVSSSLAQQLNSQQIQIVKDTAASICDTVKEARGQKNDIQIQGDVKAKLGGLIGKVADVGGSGKGALNREEFEGLSRDATATALQGDRDCRERLFNKMFDKLSATAAPSATPVPTANRAPPAREPAKIYPAMPGYRVDPDGRIVTRDTYRQRQGWWSFDQLPYPCVDDAGNLVKVVGPAPGGAQGACGQRY